MPLDENSARELLDVMYTIAQRTLGKNKILIYLRGIGATLFNCIVTVVAVVNELWPLGIVTIFLVTSGTFVLAYDSITLRLYEYNTAQKEDQNRYDWIKGHINASKNQPTTLNAIRQEISDWFKTLYPDRQWHKLIESLDLDP